MSTFKKAAANTRITKVLKSTSKVFCFAVIETRTRKFFFCSKNKIDNNGFDKISPFYLTK